MRGGGGDGDGDGDGKDSGDISHIHEERRLAGMRSPPASFCMTLYVNQGLHSV